MDLALRDPSHPTMLNPAFDSGDRVHPDDAGAEAIADIVALELLASP